MCNECGFLFLSYVAKGLLRNKLALQSFFFFFFILLLLSVSGWDVAALCHPPDWCRAVCSRVRKAHPRLPYAQPEWPDCSPEDWWVYMSLTKNLKSLFLSFSWYLFSLSSPRLYGGGSGQDEPVLQHREQHCLFWWEICWSWSLQIFEWVFHCTMLHTWSTKAVPKPSVHLAQHINTAVYQHFVVSFLAACGDLITAVFDFAHGMCALKLTEHQIALFSALVLINTGKITFSQLICTSSFWKY